MNDYEKRCSKCGKVFSGVGDVCPECTRTASQNAQTAPARLTLSGSSMFEDSMNEPSPKTIEDCTAPDKLTQSLWNWAKNLEKYGAMILVLILIGGIITALSNAKTVADYTGEQEFSTALFLASFFNTIIYAVLEYLVYHVLALLTASLARIVQSTRTTARLAEWTARNREQ